MRRTIGSAPFSYLFRRLNLYLLDPHPGDGIGEACDVDTSISGSFAHVIVPERVPAMFRESGRDDSEGDCEGDLLKTEASKIDLRELQKFGKRWSVRVIVGVQKGCVAQRHSLYE